ncbi:hypothetical protein [Pseudonocardia sp. TMWB2A]|uniref:hypothetical protein n=1 Tax=Pseudonocardia sp. TMWB2A TaxID=687430 RepID=UPI00307DC41F
MLIVSVALLTGCTQHEGIAPIMTGPPPTPPASVPPVPVPTSVQHIPGQPPLVHYGTVPDARLGVSYEYHLYVHCGIRTAQFAGRTWIAQPEATDPLTPETEIGPDQYLEGAMSLPTPDIAVFRWPGGTAQFEPATTPQGPCA